MRRIDTEARSLLLDRRNALRRSQSSFSGGSTSFLPDDGIPDGILAGRVALELAEVDAALGRIAAGQYGACIACGGPLGLQRLRAIPEARFCLGCSGHRPDDD